MKIRHLLANAVCALRPEAARFCRQIGLISDGSRADRLVEMGFECDELQNLDLRQPLLQEIAEYAGLRPEQRLSPVDVARALEATRKVINDHLQDIDQQLWMLQYRRDALERKVRTIERMLRMLRPLPKSQVA